MFLVLIGLVMMAVGVNLIRQGARMAPASPFIRRRSPGPARVAAPSPTASGGTPMARPLSGKPAEFGAARPGRRLTYKHPQRGSLSAAILGTIHYAELWQRRKAPGEPWIPTGNIFTAHWLGDTLLYHWKDRLYVLDSYDLITDAEISQQILPAAKQFGQSDETAEVSFAYPPASWTVTDIGKFQVESIEGSGLRLQAGAVGRFLHARGGTGNEGQSLVVEDYQEGGGGQDTAWRGWSIPWDDLESVK
jgi:hypothetical protein